ncbi:MAG: tetratricopeptide repeat protein [Burkholderiales bacterium]|nr:tetratricopeptide repeat protein [Burkholderiales bacterium]
MRILHISDLHLGKEDDSPTGKKGSSWRMRRVMGEAWEKNIREITQDAPIDLICFTGDLAQSGQPGQYADATRFVEDLLDWTGVRKERFFCVPGNHDIDRNIGSDAWSKVRAGAGRVDAREFGRWAMGSGLPYGFDKSWHEAVLARQDAYRQWLVDIGLSTLVPGPHGRLGYRVSVNLGLATSLHIVGFDSAWLAGDDNDSGKLWLTDEQIGRLLTDGGEHLSGWTLGLAHHPIGDLRDGAEARPLLAGYGLGLLLHGHLHCPAIERWSNPVGGLPISAAGCLYEHDRYPNSLQVLDIELGPDGQIQPVQIWARAWSKHGPGHWHDDNGLYPGSKEGRLQLKAPAVATHQTFIPGEFVGRQDELKQLCDALLPSVGQAKPTFICCSVEGMPGVGKTRLAEHFVSKHWLPALGLPDSAVPEQHLLRLVLDPTTDLQPSAAALGQRLTDQMRNPGPVDTLWQRLRASLLNGPHGKPTLLLVENVDSPAQASAVAGLVSHLPSCPVLVTARYTHMGKGQSGWAQIEVAPMSPDEAWALLRAEVDRDGHCLSEAEGNDLAKRLGYLPLALHIAASHLSVGLTPAAFLEQLREQGLDLPPAQEADPRLTVDRARAIVHSSFTLSWHAWRKSEATQVDWPQALAALSYGPTVDMGLPLASAVAGLDEAQYPRFAVSARRWSLLNYDAGTQRSSLHPLIAEFLRKEPGASSTDVFERMKAWFMPRLGERDANLQGEARKQLWGEYAALRDWLGMVSQAPADVGMDVACQGEDFAKMMGPNDAWRVLCEHLLKESRDWDDQGALLHVLGELYLTAGEPGKALDAARKSQGICLAHGATKNAAIAAGVIVDILFLQGQLDEALRICREQMLLVFEALGDKRERAVTMGKIADILQQQGQLDEALRIYQEQIQVFKAPEDKQERAVAMGKIADILQQQDRFEEALLIYHKEVLSVCEMVGDVRERAVTMGKIADVLFQQGQLDESLHIRREKQLPVYEALGEMRSLLVCRTSLAITLAERGIPEDKPEIADLLHKAYATALTMKLPEVQRIEEIYKYIFGQEISDPA